MSEIKNSTTDIDNNVQEEPKATPRKRMSRAEKALIESENLLKSLGVTMESGRQTRSSRRGPIIESPKPETPKRKPPSTPRTPRTSKKAKIIAVDQTDSTNHVEDSNKNDAQIAEVPVKNSVEPEKDVKSAVEEKPVETETVANNDEKMDVDIPIESTQSEDSTKPIETTKPEVTTKAANVPQAETTEESQLTEDSQPVAGVVESVSPKLADEPEVLEREGISAVADTTTTVVAEDEPFIREPAKSNNDDDDAEPIELQSSPSDSDSKGDTVSNSQAIKEPEAIVELESSSNEGDVDNTQKIDSLDLEVINSDSSLSGNEAQDQQTTGDEPAQEQSLPTSTAEVTITKITDDDPVEKSNDNSVHTSEQSNNSVESTNNQKPIEISEKFRTTITVENPIEETITTTSEANATTV